jgi:hypothetical protein
VPYIIRQGNQVEFIIELLDAAGLNTTPPSLQLLLQFTDESGQSAGFQILQMSLQGFVWTVVWNSGTAPLGLATLIILLPFGQVAPPDPVMRICRGP